MRHLAVCSAGLCCLIAAAVVLPASATEVTVQNDSFVNGGSAVVVGDFVAGEQAGVRLTSPCDGTIVAVQIGWLSQTGAAPQSVQQAIHIFDGSTFPTPGAELAVLNGPVLTDGFLNEFRYLDENQTIPLNVPVTAGQQFYVTLEYATGTNIVAGDASVFRDVDGCQSGKNVLFAIPGDWTNFCIFLSGDLVIRAVVDCNALTGACCLPDGSCASMTAADCATNGGTYQGDGVDCAGVTCPQPSGACCFPSTGGCLDLIQSDCTAAGGIWGGAGTDCATFVCFPIGACCLPDGTCMDNVDPNQCAAAGGVFQGDSTTCGTVTCPEPTGACCFSTGGCLVLTDADCGIAGGTWAGPGTTCDDNNGNGAPDACEAGTPCPGDVNGDNSVDITDLGLVLTNFGMNVTPGTNGDVNGDGVVDISDLGEVLANFGTTCP